MKHIPSVILIIIILVLSGILVNRWANRFSLPKGETVTLEEFESHNDSDSMAESQPEVNVQDEPATTSIEVDSHDDPTLESETAVSSATVNPVSVRTSQRQILVTDGVRHSIPLDEIAAGGPPKDGIPSIDNPKFVTVVEANGFLSNSSDIGIGLVINGQARFYPYQILVSHEIVNDVLAGEAVAVTYCPLCGTGVVFDATVDGVAREFGVSGLLWESNVLMYDRHADEDDESLWSQVLGEAVLGPQTGTKLRILPADTVTYGEWKDRHPDTEVLSQDTGFARNYDTDPYGNYYTDNDQIWFGSFRGGFTDNRLDSKEFVYGIEVDGQFKAYAKSRLQSDITTDQFAGHTVLVEQSDAGTVQFYLDTTDNPIPNISGFWFSWLGAHPDTEVF